MKMAHDRDMTFNEFVEDALRHALEEIKAGRLTKEDAREWLEEQNED
jgi:DNA-binding transcriptional regulator YhcF (GntR family)